MMERSTFSRFFCLVLSSVPTITGEVPTVASAVPVTIEDPSAVEWAVLSKAKMVAAGILEEVGVQLKWSKDAQNGPSITIAFSRHTPETLLPGAMAYALPYAAGGVRITVFLERLQPVLARSPNTRGQILGHVMAHELVHVLQGIARHSDRGLMKARWSEDDFQQMGVKPLEFTAGDRQLIRRGLASRSAPADQVAP
jgi:hypothetical protein